MPVASSFTPNSTSTSAQNATTEPDFIIDCVPNFNGIEQLFYVFAFTRVIFFLVPMITGIFQRDQRTSVRRTKTVCSGTKRFGTDQDKIQDRLLQGPSTC